MRPAEQLRSSVAQTSALKTNSSTERAFMRRSVAAAKAAEGPFEGPTLVGPLGRTMVVWCSWCWWCCDAPARDEYGVGTTLIWECEGPWWWCDWEAPWCECEGPTLTGIEVAGGGTE